MAAMHEVDFEILGDDMQFVKIELDPQEAVVAEAGGMMYMEDGIAMETIFGDGSAQQQGGLMGMLMGAGKRLLTGESLFMTVFANQSPGKRKVAFAAPYPGKIVPVHLAELGGEVICQKDSFLAAAKGVAIGIAFQRRLGVGLFGGEGFIMQSLKGDGWAFLHAGGTIEERTLAPGEVLRVDTGCIVGLVKGVDYDIEMVKGVKSCDLRRRGPVLRHAARTRQGVAAVAAAVAPGGPHLRRRAAAGRAQGGGLDPRRARQPARRERVMRAAPLAAAAVLLLGLAGCGGEKQAPEPISDATHVTGTLKAIDDGRPVDGGVTLTIATGGDGDQAVLVPSLFTGEPPTSEVLALQAKVDELKVGDRLTAIGARDGSGTFVVTRIVTP